MHVKTQSAAGPQNKQFSTQAATQRPEQKKMSFMHMFIFWENYSSSSLTNSHSKLKLSKLKT